MSSVLAAVPPIAPPPTQVGPAQKSRGTDLEADPNKRLELDAWALLGGIESPSAAAAQFRQIVRKSMKLSPMLPAARKPVFDLPQRIPQCPGMEDATFQALHFDYGAPVVHVPGPAQYTCLYTALYFPEGEPEGSAETRLLSLSPFLRDGNPALLQAMIGALPGYVRAFGDGWDRPQPFRTGRLACFARFLDAASGTPRLAHFFDQTTWQWFGDGSPSPGGTRELGREIDWFSHWGFSLPRHERRVRLRPGDLLVIDNLRACHGRLGRRQMGEVYQMMAGTWESSERISQSYNGLLASLLR